MKTIQLILLFIPFYFHSQVLSEIKVKDTLYVFFNGRKNQEKLEFVENKKDSTHKSYLYLFSDKNNLKITFFYDTHLDYDNRDKNIKALIEKKKCKFFKKNKSKIIDENYFIKNGVEESYIFLLNKFIFLVDTSEKKKGVYLLKEVKVSKSKSQE